MRTHAKRQRRQRPGVQHLWGFDNGQLASAVPDAAQIGRWELTVMNGSGNSNGNGETRASVVGSLGPLDVRRALRDVEARH